MPESKEDILRATTLDEIYGDYRDGLITRGTLNKVVREKALQGPKDFLTEKGYLGAVYGKTIEHGQEAWDQFIEGFTKGAHKFAAYDDTMGRLMWMLFKMGAAPVMAMGEVNRAYMERLALQNGASPGYARGIGIVAEIGTNFLPVRAAAKGLQKGVEKVASKVSGKIDEAGAIVQKEVDAAKQVIDDTVREALEADGLAIETIAATGTEGPKTLIKAIDPLNRGKRPKLTSTSPLPDEMVSALDTLKMQMPKFGATPTLSEFDTLRKLARAAIKNGDSDSEMAFAKYMAAMFSPPTRKELTKSFQVGRGANGSVTVQFPNENLADLYAAIGRSRRTISGQGGIKPNWEGLAARFGVPVNPTPGQTHIGKLAVDYRELITNAVKGLEAGATLKAPRLPGMAGEAASVSDKINYSKQMMGLLHEWAPELMAQGNLRGAMKMLAEDISALSVRQLSGGANLNLVHTARQNQGFFPGMRQLYTNMLLPLSGSAAFIGNSVAANMAIAERFMVSPTQGYYLTKGMMLGVGDGLAAFGKALKGIPNPNAGRFSFPITGPIPGRTGRIVNAPTSFIDGIDRLFVEMFTRGSFYATAAREGVNQGLRGANLGNFIRNSVYNVHNPANPIGQIMRTEAKAFSEYNTFQNQLMPLAREIQSAIYTNIPGTNFRPGQFYFPFFKSAVNLTKYSYDRTPILQMASYRLWSDMAAGGARGDSAAGRLIMGNMMGMYFYELAKEGFITGNGPADPRQRAAWLLDNKPNSIKLGDGSFLSNKFVEPVSTIMSLVADYAMIRDQIDEMTALKMAHAIVYVAIENFGNNSWWMGASQMVNLVQGDLNAESAKKLLAQPIVNIAHGGPAGTRIAKAIDPTERETRTWWDQIISGVPVWSSTLPVKRDLLGDELAISRPAINSWFGLLGQNWPKFTDMGNDPIKKLMAKLQVQAANFPDSIGAGPIEDEADITPEQAGSVQPMSRLTNAQKDRWQEIYKRMLRDGEFGLQKQYIESDLFKLLPPAGQRVQLQGAITDYRAAAKDMLIMEDKQLGKKIFTNQAEAEIKQLPVEMRPEAQRSLQEGLDLFDSLSADELKNIMKWGDLSATGEENNDPLQLNVAPSR